MKPIEKNQARAMRKTGMAIKIIAEQLNISPGSVSRWVADIELTEIQKSKLKSNSLKGALKRKEYAEEKRKKYQQNGAKLILQKNPDYIAGCMLYWAEGDKKKNQLGLSNSDPYLMKIFINFMRKNFNLPNDRFSVTVHCYTNNGITIEEIQSYWIKTLLLSKDNLKKPLVNQVPKSSKLYKKNKLLYGVCHLKVLRSTEIVQTIFGSISQYGNMKDYFVLH